MKNEFDLKIMEFKRGLVAELLNQLTERQKELFVLTYGSIETIKEDKMRTAYFHCKRTLKWKKR